MTEPDDRQHRAILQRIAHRTMLERGLAPDFPVQALAEHCTEEEDAAKKAERQIPKFPRERRIAE